MSSRIHYNCIKTISCNCPKCFHENYECLKNKSCKCLVCITGNLPICGEKTVNVLSVTVLVFFRNVDAKGQLK